MFAPCRTRLWQQASRVSITNLTGHKATRCRTLFTESFSTLSEGFLDLSLAIPYPPYIPPYSGTIILTTVLSRLLFTLPISIWAKKRQWRVEESVLPALRDYRIPAAKRIGKEMSTSFRTKDVEKFKAEHTRRLREDMKAFRDQLMKQHNCSTLPSVLLPALTQLPLFIGGTLFFSNLAAKRVPIDAESFLTLTSLARPDHTSALPIAYGLISLANVETARWFISEEKAEREKRAEEAYQKKKAEGVFVPPPMKNVVQSTLRILSVARIVVGAMVDGSVILYWITSATFGLFQTWGFDWWEARRALRRKQVTKTPSSPA